jgi:pimeloyl-ACP methyl ester carboxylesterase
MKQFIEAYERKEYAALVGHGYRILAEAVECNLPYAIDCPALLMCGEHDKAGSTRRYNRAWAEKSGITVAMGSRAGHNSNTDNPKFVNAVLREFLASLEASATRL